MPTTVTSSITSLLISLDGKSVSTELQAALERNAGARAGVVHDHGSKLVNRNVAAVIKAHNLIDIETRPRHPESNGIVERFAWRHAAAWGQCTAPNSRFDRLCHYVAKRGLEACLKFSLMNHSR